MLHKREHHLATWCAPKHFQSVATRGLLHQKSREHGLVQHKLVAVHLRMLAQSDGALFKQRIQCVFRDSAKALWTRGSTHFSSSQRCSQCHPFQE